MKLNRIAKMVAAYAEAFETSGDVKSASELKKLADALKQKGGADLDLLEKMLNKKVKNEKYKTS